MSLRKTLTTVKTPLSEATIATGEPDVSKTVRPSSKITLRPRKIRKVTSETSESSPPVVHAIFPTRIPLSSQFEIDAALRHLRDADPLLAAVISAHKPPIFESSGPPFLSLARSILYQQLATKAAKCIYDRFVSLFTSGEIGIHASAVRSLSAAQLRQIGVSGRKASYLHDLADKYVNGELSDSSIMDMNDEELIRGLTAVKGIGVWTVHMFMVFRLHRPDVLPVGDLGVRKGVKLLYGLKELPGPMQMESLCEKWRPYRSVASWYMWRLIEAQASSSSSAAATAGKSKR